MRLANLRLNLDVRTALLASAILAASGCQTAQKPVSLLPPGSAPTLQPTPAPAPVSSLASQAGPQTQKDVSVEPASAEGNTTSPQQSQAAPSAADPVADLIDRAEREYQEGVANYHAGNSASAKQNFDNALNALLSSNLDIRSDERLQKEFDHIVEGVNQLYPGGTAADSEQAQDNQQKSEPAPIDQTNDATNGLAPAADASVRAKAEAEIKHTRSDLPLMMTDQVAGYITYFSGYGRGPFERAFARSGRYHDMIVATLKEQGLPQELIYLAQAESGFHPQAVSKAGARGIWQFMGSRGIGYGLHHNMWVDDRQDPEKSTRAAARHLKDLYNQFGDWYLAMAAYNSGPGTVQAAVKRTGYADFWELYNRNVLPKETKNYVPIILAVTIMAKNPAQYGLDSLAMEHPAEYDTVKITYPVDLRLVAECINSTPEELQDLNPSLLRLTTPREGQFDLHLPAGSKDQYETAIASVPADMRLWWRYHTVHSGDTLATLARTYHVTAKSISEANHLDGPELEADAKLVIPVAPGKHPLNDTATYARRITRYKVHAGDTVETVADNFGVSPQMLRRWNGIRGNSLSGRRIIALHLPISPSAHQTEVASARTSSQSHTSKTKHPAAAPAPAESATVKPPATKSAQIERLEVSRLNTKEVVHHKVKSGETLYSIANAYRTTVAALKRDNRNVAVIRPGMILTVQLTR
jgi:membrane-bound lytic murein transglycosylase D